MQDKLGVYYNPIPGNKELRTYIRLNNNDIEFRLWSAEDPELWEEHGWVPWTAIKEAERCYASEGKGSKPPMHLYDLDAAFRLLKDFVQDYFHEKGE